MPKGHFGCPTYKVLTCYVAILEWLDNLYNLEMVYGKAQAALND